MKATGRKHKIVIERFSLTTDDYGGEVQAWSAYATQWAAVFYGSGNEQRDAAQEQASQTASFEVVSTDKSRTYTPVDRVLFKGRYWDIHAVNEIGMNEGVKLTCVARDGGHPA